MLTRPLTRPITASLAQPLTAAPLVSASSGTTWDAANKGSDVTLSNGNLTASSTGQDNGMVGLTTARNSGYRTFRVQLTYVVPSASANGAGLGPSDWVAGDILPPGSVAGSFGLYEDGHAYANGVDAGISRPVPSGGWAHFAVKFNVAGDTLIWVGNEASGWSGDPETNTSPTFTIAGSVPSLLPIAALYAFDTVTPSDAVYDGDWTSGTSTAWNTN